MAYRCNVGYTSYVFDDLKAVLAKASPSRSGDVLAGLAAESYEQRVAAQMVLADIPLKDFLGNPVISFDEDEVTRLIFESHDQLSFAHLSHFTVGELRDWLLGEQSNSQTLSRLSAALTPEMVAAVSKLMRDQDLINVSQRGEGGRRLQDNEESGYDQCCAKDRGDHKVPKYDRAKRTVVDPAATQSPNR